jgi:hypothetical protein
MSAAAGSDGAAMRRAVKRLSFGATWEEKAEAAAEIGRLGVVPPLLSMLVDAGGASARVAAVRALLKLARGTHRSVTDS